MNKLSKTLRKVQKGGNKGVIKKNKKIKKDREIKRW